jgi:uncharacterized protein (DUF1499 family)
MRIARVLAMAFAVAAFTMLLASGPGTRLGLWPWQTAFSLLKWATYTGLAAGAAALVLSFLAVVPRWRAGAWVPALALAFAVAAAAPPIILLERAKVLPDIHDITTDTSDPPAFVALMPERMKALNGASYGGAAVAAEQKKGYPDIKPLVLKAPPRDVLQRAQDAARALGWEVIASDAESGRLEATATTLWFGFKDDVVVRIRPEGSGSRVDIRSMSRVGSSDVGANAKRIREFLAKLAPPTP